MGKLLLLDSLLQELQKMNRIAAFCILSSAFALEHHHQPIDGRLRRVGRVEEDEVAVVKAQEPSLLARLIGEETQARVVESISDWANDKARENPGCVERFVCETYKTGETMNGLPYLAMSLTNAAVSFMVAEQFGEVMEMEAITRAARLGRTLGSCHRMECPVLDGQLRTVTDYLAGFEEMLGYIVNSVSTSLG